MSIYRTDNYQNNSKIIIKQSKNIFSMHKKHFDHIEELSLFNFSGVNPENFKNQCLKNQKANFKEKQQYSQRNSIKLNLEPSREL